MINKTKTKFAWPNKRVKIRWPFDRQRVVWFPRFLGLGLLVVLVSYFSFVEPCLDMDVCPGYPGSLKVRQIMAHPTFRVFGRSLEGFGRLWWMEEQKHYFVVYLEVTLSGSSSTP